MADVRKLYIELIADYDPYTDLSEHKHLSMSAMRYNLMQILENNKLDNFIHDSDVVIYNRFRTLIELFNELI